MWKRSLTLLIGALAFMAAGPASAHPHVWVDAKATLVFDKGKITAIRMHWSFDPLFTTLVMSEHDKDKNKTFSPAEVTDLEKNAFDNLKNHSYFTHLRLNDKVAKVSSVKGFKPSYVKGKLVYEFTILLDRPIDPLKTRFGVGVYDESFYIAVEFEKKNPIGMIGSGSAGCSHEIVVDKKNPFYSGIIFPRIATLRCAGS